MHKSHLVFSTTGDNVCDICHKYLHKCKCNKQLKASSDGVIRIKRETKGRKGSGMTVIFGLSATSAELRTITTDLKKYCGVGGSLKKNLIEIQGDQRLKCKYFLEQLGYKPNIN